MVLRGEIVDHDPPSGAIEVDPDKFLKSVFRY